MEDDVLEHIGVLRKSGRYPWGSGENPHQRNKGFLNYVDSLKKDGLSELEIAQGMGMSVTELRNVKSIAKNALRKEAESQALRLKDSGMSNVAIGKEMGINESQVRALLNPANQARSEILNATSEALKAQVAERGYIDIGVGSEQFLGVSGGKLKTAVAKLQEDGYKVYYVKVEQLGTGKETTVKVLAPPDTTYSDVFKNKDQINVPNVYSEDGGRTFLGMETPKSVSSDRVAVRYAEEGGSNADGVIYVRPGVDDVSLGGARYAQVRIAVDGDRYLKGMAMYKDDLPDGVDLMFNTNKSNTGNKLDAMKKQSDDPDNPFGAVVRQRHYIDKDGKKQLSAMNIVNEEGQWDDWSRSLSSQMLSKQTPALAKRQLDISLESKKTQLEEIMSLTNPAVKKKLLDTFADDADSASVHLKAAALPRQKTQVILPINSLKDTEIYAPQFRNGESVVLIRYPHGGTFEIPELRVNNRNAEGRKNIGTDATDAVGINAKTAARLSGADFDGDTVLVIPNNSGAVRTSPPLKGLKGFDPQTAYPGYEGMKPMSTRAKQKEMGDVSNLITDMTIKGANDAEIARAVRHSMVVIDAEKHKLNYKQSHKDNNIAELKQKYQGRSNAGAATLVSRASSDIRVPDRIERPAKRGGPIDPVTGRKVYEETGASYTDKNGKVVQKKVKSTKMAETTDAHTLSSGTPMEAIYADHANRLKAMANTARKESLATPPVKRSPSAAVVYKDQVASLDAKVALAFRNKPLERKAQLLANTTVSAKRQANPDMENSEIKKIKGLALEEARRRVGAKKTPIEITPTEWEAIQAGAISNKKMVDILNNTDVDKVKKLATPRTASVMTPATMARAKAMLARGATQAEVADALGVPTSTLNEGLKREG